MLLANWAIVTTVSGCVIAFDNVTMASTASAIIFFLLAFFSLLAVDWNIFFFALLAALCCQIESAGVAWRGYFMGSVGTLWWPSHLHKSWHTNTLWKGGPNGPEGRGSRQLAASRYNRNSTCSAVLVPFFILFAFLFLYVYMQSGHKICKNF